jgi:signal transduction histidine kinase
MPQAATSPSWRARITGRWALSWQAYALGVAVNLPLLILTGGRIGTRVVPTADMPVLAAYGLAAAVLVGAWALLMNATLVRDRRVRPVGLWRFAVVHAVSGAVFGAAIVLADSRIGIDVGVPPAMTMALTVGLGLWWGVVTAMLFEARERFHRQRAALLDEAVLGQLSSIEDSRMALTLAEEASAARVEVSEQLSSARADLQSRIQESGHLGDWLAAADLMRSTADDTVRPLSHALWEEASLRYPEPRVSGVLGLLLREPTFLPIPAASVIVIGYIGASTLANGALVGLALAGVLGVLAWGLLALGNAAIHRFRGWRHVIYLGVVCAVQAATLIVAFGPAQADNAAVPTSLIAGSILGTLIAIVLTSVIASLDESRAAVIAQLSSIVNAERLSQEARSRSRSLALRELAQDLHGSVQTRLIACASALEMAARAGDSAGCLEALRESVRVLEGMRSSEEVMTIERLNALARSWSPICEVSVRIDASLASLRNDDVVRVVEEAIGNAYRHGEATRVDVEIAPSSHGLLDVRVCDDGRGPGGGPAGLGTDLLTRATRGQFTLSAGSSGGTVLVARLPAEG